MNLFKSFRVAALALALVIPALAEQRIVTAVGMSRGYSSPVELPLGTANALLRQGWRVASVSVTSSCSGDTGARQYLIIFVLESPPSPTQLDETTSTDDLFRIRKLTPEEIAREKAKIKEGK